MRKAMALLLPTTVKHDLLYAKAKAKRRAPRSSMWIFLLLALVFIVSVYTTHLVSPCYIGWLWHYRNSCTSNTPHPWQAAVVKSLRPQPKIAIAMIVDNFMQPDIRNLTIRNKERYARIWGYDLFVPNQTELSDLAGDLPVAWAKFPLIKKVLRTHDYVFVVDADAVILREDISLHKAATGMGSASLLISNDHNGPNSGVFMMKRSYYTSRFLEEAMHSASILSETSRKYPLRFENRAFFYLLDAWPSCGRWRRVDAILAPAFPNAQEYIKGVQTVDRCLINRRPPRARSPLELFDSGASFDSIDNAFIAHAAGGSIQTKIEALRWLLRVTPLS